MNRPPFGIGAMLCGLGFIAFIIASRAGEPMNPARRDLPSLQARQIGAVHPLIQRAHKIGNLAPDRMLHMVISFQPNNEDQISLLIADLYDPRSPNYHKWLTPQNWSDRFGRSMEEVQHVAAWLESGGFTVDKVWENRLAISFSGAAAVVQNTFRVELVEFQHPREPRTFFANLQPPQLPPEIDAITVSLVGLNNAAMRHHPNHSQAARQVSAEALRAKFAGQRQNRTPDLVIFGTQILGPLDLQFAYGYASLIPAGVNSQGTGQTVGIIMDSDVLTSDINTLRSTIGVAALGTNGSALNREVPPGLTNPGTKFEDEAELDVACVTAVAPAAVIDLIVIPSLDNSKILTAENYVVNTLKPPVVNESFSGLEADNYDSSEDTLFQQAVAEGIAFFVSSGDEGTACFDGTGGLTKSVQTPAAYGYVTAVGGTAINGTFDADGNLTAVTSDVAWNTPPGVRSDCDEDRTFGGASGGGISAIVPRPSYQAQYSKPNEANGTPVTQFRSVPDLALAADINALDVIYFEKGNSFFASGTSESSPLMAGMMALINQSKSAVQGWPNPELYRLGALQYDGGGPSAFRDITSGNNSVAAVMDCFNTPITGYSAAVGYDSVTGWGAPAIAVLAQNFPTGTLTISAVARLPDGQVRITGIGAPKEALSVRATISLSGPFSTLTNVSSNGAGAFSFQDATSASVTARFYQLSQ